MKKKPLHISGSPHQFSNMVILSDVRTSLSMNG